MARSCLPQTISHLGSGDMRGRSLLLALVGGGAVWTIHLFASYFLAAIGCPRGWAALGWLVGILTAVCAAAAVAVALAGRRRMRRARPARDGEATEAQRLLLTVGIVLGALFAIMIVAGGVAAVALSPCPTIPGATDEAAPGST